MEGIEGMNIWIQGFFSEFFGGEHKVCSFFQVRFVDFPALISYRLSQGLWPAEEHADWLGGLLSSDLIQHLLTTNVSHLLTSFPSFSIKIKLIVDDVNSGNREKRSFDDDCSFLGSHLVPSGSPIMCSLCQLCRRIWQIFVQILSNQWLDAWGT